MKTPLNIFIAIVIIALLGYVIWSSSVKNHTPKKINPTEQEIRAAATKLRQETGGGMQIETCDYKGEVVMKIDMRPVDGPLTIYDLNGNEIGMVTSGFGGPVQSNIDENAVVNCEVVLGVGEETTEETKPIVDTKIILPTISRYPDFVLKAYAGNKDMVIRECSYGTSKVYIFKDNTYDGYSSTYNAEGKVVSSGGGQTGEGKTDPSFDNSLVKNCETIYAPPTGSIYGDKPVDRIK